MANVAVDGNTVGYTNLLGNPQTVITSASGDGYGQDFFKVGGVNVVVDGANGARVPDHFSGHTNVRFDKPGFFFKINGASVIIDGDAANCAPAHTITGTGFLNVIP